MHCTNCGAALEDSELFCGNCGTPVRRNAPPPVAGPATVAAPAPGPQPYPVPAAPPAPSYPPPGYAAPMAYPAPQAYPARRAPAPANNWGWFSIGCVIGVTVALVSLVVLVFVLVALASA